MSVFSREAKQKIGEFTSLLSNVESAHKKWVDGENYDDYARRLIELEKLVPPGMHVDRSDFGPLADAYRFAQVGDPVLLVGETGTGKSFYAKFIAMHRADKKLHYVNCSMLAENLLESELFGHEKGAHSTATARRSGLLETATGSTLFIDEFQEAGQTIQRKLKTFIEDGFFHRVGSDTAIQSDAKIVIAMNEKADRLLPDFSFRIPHRIVTIPLRKKMVHDGFYQLLVKEVCRHAGLGNFTEKEIRKADQETQSIIDKLSPPDPRVSPPVREVRKEHTEYPWPGNMRELSRWVRAMFVCGRYFWPPHSATQPVMGPIVPNPAQEIAALRQSGLKEGEVAAEMTRRHGRGFCVANIRRKYPKGK